MCNCMFCNDFKTVELKIMLYTTKEECFHYYYPKSSKEPLCNTNQHQITIILTKEFVKKRHGDTYLWKNKKN